MAGDSLKGLTPMVRVRDLSVTLDGQRHLSGVSFDVEKGEALAIIGPNGAGKSLLFRALLGLVPYRGEIIWHPEARIGYVPQRFPIDRTMPLTVEEFFLLKSNRFWSPSKRFFSHLHHELGRMGLSVEILKQSLGFLSSGQLQRILIVWAMLDHPNVVLFDEPTAGIDVGFEENIYHLMRRLQEERGTTILLISHELNVVYRYANQVLCLNKEMLCHGRPQEVLHPDDLMRLFGERGFYPHETHVGM